MSVGAEMSAALQVGVPGVHFNAGGG